MHIIIILKTLEGITSEWKDFYKLLLFSVWLFLKNSAFSPWSFIISSESIHHSLDKRLSSLRLVIFLLYLIFHVNSFLLQVVILICLMGILCLHSCQILLFCMHVFLDFFKMALWYTSNFLSYCFHSTLCFRYNYILCSQSVISNSCMLMMDYFSSY